MVPKLADLCGWAILAVVLFHVLGDYGTRWDIGRYGMPVALLADDGRHYQDGSEADPVTIWLVRNEAMEISILGIVGLGVTALACRLGFEFWSDRQQKQAAVRDAAETPAGNAIGIRRLIDRIVEDARRIARRVASTGKRGM